MTRREAWATAIAIYVLALAVRSIAAAAVPFPVPEDTAYYWGVARNVLEGRGLVSDALWSFTLPPLVFPRPAFEIWLPLPTFLALPFMAVLGTGFRAAQVSSVLVSAAVPVLAWRLAADVADERGLSTARARAVAVGSGTIAAFYGPLVLFGALPDSTAPFTVAALAACLLMARVARDPRGARVTDPRLLGLGVALGIAALTRNEAIWYALAWLLVAAGIASSLRGSARSVSPGRSGAAGEPAAGLPQVAIGDGRLAALVRLVTAPAVVAIAVFAPWAARSWATFGSPLPGQAVANAFSRTGFDIFAWQDPPSFAKWVAQGPAKLVADRVEGFTHNLVTVLLVPAFPVGPVGLIGLPWILRSRALRPLLIGGALTFLATTLLFPVATTWGTFLHAAGPIHVLLVVTAATGLDALVSRLAQRRRWGSGNVALAPISLLILAAPFLALTVLGIGGVSQRTEQRYADLAARLEAAGLPLAANSPVIADFPIWIAVADRASALALPDEPPASVLDLARTFGAKLLIVADDGSHGRWPAVLATGAPGAACFAPVPGAAVPGVNGGGGTLVYRIACP